ncbi:hypothetical protein ACFV0T_37545 [Streptomyces sp. NPDC059582]|uniref:hypothetical protein n=1 Tax=Streptomyces sp. NPDC059582 TaxID=3346875 RepID=UPI0036A205C1
MTTASPTQPTEAISKGEWLDVELTDERLTAALNSAYWTDWPVIASHPTGARTSTSAAT